MGTGLVAGWWWGGADLLKVLNPSGSKYWDIVFFCQRVNTNWSRLLISSLPLSLLRELLWLVLLLLFFCWYIPFALDFSYIFFSDNWFYSSAEGLKKNIRYIRWAGGWIYNLTNTWYIVTTEGFNKFYFIFTTTRFDLVQTYSIFLLQ